MHVPLPFEEARCSPSMSLAARRARDDARRVESTARCSVSLSSVLFFLFPRDSLSSYRDSRRQKVEAPATGSRIAPRGPRVSSASSRSPFALYLPLSSSSGEGRGRANTTCRARITTRPRHHENTSSLERETIAKQRRNASHPERATTDQAASASRWHREKRPRLFPEVARLRPDTPFLLLYCLVVASSCFLVITENSPFCRVIRVLLCISPM